MTKIVVVLLFLSGFGWAQTQCGTERWAVKTLQDKTASRISDKLTDVTVPVLTGLAAPAHRPELTRLDGPETTFWHVFVKVLGYKIETDRDLHVVAANPQDDKDTFVIEVPDPNCAPSRFAQQFADIRSRIQKHGRATAKIKWLDKPFYATFTGPGFFDKIHGQDGVAPNGFEIHPALTFEDNGFIASLAQLDQSASLRMKRSQVRVLQGAPSLSTGYMDDRNHGFPLLGSRDRTAALAG